MLTSCLPSTGSNSIVFLVVGLVAVAAGAVALRSAAGRRTMLALVLAGTVTVLLGGTSKPASAACAVTTTSLAPDTTTTTAPLSTTTVNPYYISVVNGGQISNDYPYTQGPTATSFKVCEVTGDTAPFTETNCVNFAPSDPIGTVKLLPTTGPTDTQWLVMTDLGDGQGLSTGVMVFSAMPTQSDLNNQTTGSLITSQITCTDQAQTAAFQKSTGDTIYTGLFTSC